MHKAVRSEISENLVRAVVENSVNEFSPDDSADNRRHEKGHDEFGCAFEYFAHGY
jgi:hypothetical protein